MSNKKCNCCKCECHQEDPKPLRCGCTKSKPGDSKIQKIYCDYKPPDVSGKWRIQQCSLRQDTPESVVDFNDIEYAEHNFTFLQKGLFVIVLQDNHALKPDASEMIGGWIPIYLNTKLSGWRLIITDHDDYATHEVQVVEQDANGRPTIINFAWYDSGFLKGNDLQEPIFGYGLLQRIDE